MQQGHNQIPANKGRSEGGCKKLVKEILQSDTIGTKFKKSNRRSHVA